MQRAASLIAVLALAAAGCAGDDLDGEPALPAPYVEMPSEPPGARDARVQRGAQEPVAIVAGVEIEKPSFDRWVRAAAPTRRPEVGKRAGVLELVVTTEWLEAEAQTRGISLAAADVDGAVERERDRPGGGAEAFIRFLPPSAGITIDGSALTADMVVARARANLLADRLIDAFVVPGDEVGTINRLARFRERWRKRTACADDFQAAVCNKEIAIIG